MKNNAFAGLCIAVLCIALFADTTKFAQADPIKPYWERQRQAMMVQGRKSCRDRDTLYELEKLAVRDADPIAAYWMYWSLSSRKCKTYKRDKKRWRRFLKISTDAGYPIALRELGRSLMSGYAHRKNSSLGRRYLEQARDAGLGLAAGDLAFYHAQGKYIPRNKSEAVKNYRIAIAEGVSDSSMGNVRRVFPKSYLAEIGRTNPVAKSAAKTNSSTKTPAQRRSSTGVPTRTAGQQAEFDRWLLN